MTSAAVSWFMILWPLEIFLYFILTHFFANVTE